MSRVGTYPIALPKGVDMHVGNGVVQIKGPRGSLLVNLLPGITAELKDGALTLNRESDVPQQRAYHGLNRALINNATIGVSDGWRKTLDIIGIGYKAEVQGQVVVFNLGYSHPINFKIPEGIEIEVDPKANRVTVIGNDRQQVGQVAANIRNLRPPEPYKGKGVRYTDEYVRMKAGKQGATA